MNDKVKETEEKLVAYAKELGHWPSQKEWNDFATNNDVYSTTALYFHTKTNWETYRKKFGFTKKIRSFSRDECINALILASKEIGEIFGVNDYEKWRTSKNELLPTRAQIQRSCKSWNNAKKEAGLITHRCLNKKFFTEEACLDALKECSNDYKRIFNEQEYMTWRKNNVSYPHIETIRSKLKSVPKAKEYLNIDTYYQEPPQYSDLDCIEALSYFVSDSLSCLAYDIWRKQNNAPNRGTIVSKLGSYDKAIIKACEIFIDKVKNGDKRL